ncbi:hypothetical protein OSTOST_15789 [Ostertagia ostertagi]
MTFTRLLYFRVFPDPGYPRSMPPYSIRLKELGLRSLLYRRIFADLVMAFKILKDALLLNTLFCSQLVTFLRWNLGPLPEPEKLDYGFKQKMKHNLASERVATHRTTPKDNIISIDKEDYLHCNKQQDDSQGEETELSSKKAQMKSSGVDPHANESDLQHKQY